MAPDESNVESPIDLASLQRELEALRAKVMVLEHDNKRYHSDEETDDEMLEFRAGDEVQMVDEAWSKWRMRREFASDIIRKADRMKQLRSQGKFIKAKQLDAEYNGNSYPPPPPPPPIRTIEMTEMSKLVPALHECTWTDFSGSTHLGKEIKQPKYVIDVLIGKPLVVWGRRGRLVDNSVAMQSDAPEPTARGSAQKAPAELPDRIRINSKLLLSVLGSSIFFPGMFGPFETVVFTSPFKILLHYQDDIRTSYEELLQKYAATSPVDKEDSTPIPIPAPVSTDISAEGDNGKPVTKINVVAQSCSQVSLEGNTEPVREEEAIHTELALQQLRVLIQFLDKYVVPRQQHINGPSCQKVTFQDLWLLFQPGQTVVGAEQNQAYRILQIKAPPHKAIPPWEVATTKQSDSTSTPHPPVPLPPGVDPVLSLPASFDRSFRLSCAYIDTDGFALGPRVKEICLDHFEGEKRIEELPIYPLRYSVATPQSSKLDRNTLDTWDIPLRDRLIKRGKEFVDLTSIRHAYYAGPTYNSRDILEGQVVIDNTHVFMMNKDIAPPTLQRWIPSGINIPHSIDGLSDACNGTCCSLDHVWSDENVNDLRNAIYLDSHVPFDRDGRVPLFAIEQTNEEVRREHQAGKVSDDEYLIMSDRVYGFVLRSRRWAELGLAYLSKVQYGTGEPTPARGPHGEIVQRTAFDDLVLPKGHREVILGLVAQHFRDEEHHEVDIFRGKGKGLILLLHGAPGVGKTSTAEGVAEAFEKPLLQITCGDLGFTAKEVEEALERNFELASRWDCVLLLDEADVFLASRAQAVTGADLNRNALVAVFLRVLEYYTGILFLTTNRIGDFDEAFASRIHVSLEYPQLTEESTQTILDLNIRLIKERFKKNGKAIAIDEDNIRFKISGYWHQNQHARLNGRQIRNACQTALALAEFDAQGGNHKRAPDVDAKVVLKSNYFDTVLRAYLDFNKYLKNIYGISPEERAREKGLRAGDTMDSNGGFSHSQSSNLGPSSPGFPGAHLYPQHVQPPSFNTNTNQPTALYQPHLQGHQSFQLPTQGQQMFMPVQSSTAVSPYQVPPPPHQDGQHLTNVKPEYDSGQASANTTAGHGIPIQVPPYNMVPGTQYHQPR